MLYFRDLTDFCWGARQILTTEKFTIAVRVQEECKMRILSKVAATCLIEVNQDLVSLWRRIKASNRSNYKSTWRVPKELKEAFKRELISRAIKMIATCCMIKTQEVIELTEVEQSLHLTLMPIGEIQVNWYYRARETKWICKLMIRF